MEKEADGPKYEVWTADYTESTNSSETVGAIRIFKRGYTMPQIQICDSDSFTHNSIVCRNLYENECIPNKLESTGHVQKQVVESRI